MPFGEVLNLSCPGLCPFFFLFLTCWVRPLRPLSRLFRRLVPGKPSGKVSCCLFLFITTCFPCPRALAGSHPELALVGQLLRERQRGKVAPPRAEEPAESGPGTPRLSRRAHVSARCSARAAAGGPKVGWRRHRGVPFCCRRGTAGCTFSGRGGPSATACAPPPLSSRVFIAVGVGAYFPRSF